MENIIGILVLAVAAVSVFVYRPYSRYIEEKYGYDAGGFNIVLSLILLVLLIWGGSQEMFLPVGAAIAGFAGLFVYRCYWVGVPHAVGLTLCQLLSALVIAIVKLIGMMWNAMTGFAFGSGGANTFTQKQSAHRERKAAIRRKYEAEASSLPEDDGDHGDEIAGMEAEIDREMQAELSEERARFANEEP